MESVLVVDDEPGIRDIVGEILEDEGYRVVTAENAENARREFESQSPDIVLLDIWMPDTDGISLLKEWTEQGANTPVVMISGHGTVETAVEAIRLGAYDFLEKPLSTAKLIVTVDRALQNVRLLKENAALRNRVQPSAELVGKSPAIDSLRDQIEKIAPTDHWVVVTGEAGSGKGVVARRLHQASSRAKGPFVEINLGAVPTENIAIQLFGREVDGRIQLGCFEEARGGTLVLDEISDLDLEMQGKLLGALEKGSYLRVGGVDEQEIDVRIIGTTNQDIEQKIEEKTFREDLYYRLNVVSLRVPPLREHREDVPELLDYYLSHLIDDEKLPYRKLNIAAVNFLRNYHWPGNVRELRNLLQRLLVIAVDEEIDIADVEAALGRDVEVTAEPFPESSFDHSLRDARESFERAYFSYHLEQLDGNVTALAQRAGMERTHLYRKLKGLGIDPKARRPA